MIAGLEKSLGRQVEKERIDQAEAEVALDVGEAPFRLHRAAVKPGDAVRSTGSSLGRSSWCATG